MCALLLIASTGPVVLPATPWWDAAWIGDALVVVGFVVAWLLYKDQQRSQERIAVRSQRKSTLDHLNGVKAALEAWANPYFTTSYAGSKARDRSELDFNQIMSAGYFQNYQVSTEPVATLLLPPSSAWSVEPEMVTAASIALQRMRVFNQLVQQQTDFNVLHAAELRDPSHLTDERRMAIALTARRISENIHGGAIGDAGWYSQLMQALSNSISVLSKELGIDS